MGFLDQDRLTVSVSVYHQERGGKSDPKGIDRKAFERFLKTSEQPVERKMDIVEGTPQPIYLGWLKSENIGYILIENRSTWDNPNVNPTAEEKADVAQRLLRVTQGDEKGWIVHPGEFFFAHPEDASKILLTSVYGTVNIISYAFPL